MSKIDETNAVNQADLEAARTDNTPQWEVKSFDGNSETPVENEVAEETNIVEDGVAELIEDAPAPQEQEEVQPQGEAEVVEENVIDIDLETTSEESVQEALETTSDLPDWIEKLKSFHEDTGGGIEEYLNYTKDVDSLNDTDVLREYYKLTKPNYSAEDIDLIIDEKYGTKEYGEGEEMSREDKLKMLALKDELSDAKQFLNTNKEKYYADLKSGVQGAPEQYKEAVEFHENFKKQSEHQQAVRDVFIEESKQVFNENFKGFAFDAGGQNYRIKVGNGQSVMESQLDLNDVVGKFLNEDGSIADVQGWHKALWAAQNSDKLFNAGVEAGKALMAKERAQATKNPDYSNEGPSSPPQQKQKYRFLG